MIRFSIITCTYQAEKVLQRTLDSTLCQTYPAVEHIIIDGASEDGTWGIIEDYEQENASEGSLHEVHVICEPDKGLYDAMNKGIARATGDYLCFLNAGDVFPSSLTLEKIAAGMAEGEQLPGVLYGDTDVVDDAGHFLRHRRLTPPEHLSWRSFKQGMLVCHQAFYARVDLAKQTLYDLSYVYSADVDWCIRIMKAAEEANLPLRNVHQVVVNYLAGGMSIKNHRASLQERFRTMHRHYGLLTTLVMHVWFVVRAFLRR